MIKPASLEKLIYKYDFVPQAVLALPVQALAKRFGWQLEKGHDDLDEYVGAAAWLDSAHPFTVMHYRGHPKDTSTIYLPFDIRNVDEITALISRIVFELEIPTKMITWQRKDKPEL